MTRRIEHVAFYLLIAAGVLLVCWSIRWWRERAGGMYCPGNMRPWSGWLFPWKWLIAGTCGYDLRGTPVAANGSVTCSECGRSHPSLRSAWRSRRRLRVGTTAAGLLAIAVTGYSVRPVRKGTWTKSMPTDVLLAVQRTLGEWTTRHVRAELEARFDRGELSDRQKRGLAAAAVQAMADDREEWNALWAMDMLSVLGDAATEPLEAGLNSNDWQQRQLCADVLRNRYVPGWYEVGPFETRVPPQRLIEVSVEGLADDGLPFGPARYWGAGKCAETWVCNARSGLAFLARCGPEAEPVLRPALRSVDAQQRFLAACAAGYAADTGLAEEAIAILVPHLHRDQIDCNAKLATGALFALGQPARQAIESLAASSKESQERSIAQRILLEWSGPAATQTEYESRRANSWLWSEDPFEDVRSDQVPSFHPFPEFP